MNKDRIFGLGIGLLLSVTSVNAATITAVANGSWSDVATWDCNCIPTSTDDVIIGGALTVNTSAAVTVQSLTVNASAVFTVNSGTFTVTGSVTILSPGAFNNTYIVEVAGDLTNNGALSGPGTYCVTGVTTNTSSMLGPMDFCDLSPPPATPFVDNNTGFIQGNVLFCQNGICIPAPVGEKEIKAKEGEIAVIYSNGRLQVVLERLNAQDLIIEIVDLQGRTVWKDKVHYTSQFFEVPEHITGIVIYRLSTATEILGQGKLIIK